MGILVVLLVAAWGLVLGPALLQSANSPITTERMFRKSLRALGGNRAKPPALGGRNILVPPKPAYPLHGEALTPLGRPVRVRSTAAERRRRSITYLAVFIIATFLLGFGIRPLRFLLVVNLFADLLLVTYLGLAMYLTVWPPHRERRERHPAVPVADPQLQPQRVAEGGF